jgi:hypothetical protein
LDCDVFIYIVALERGFEITVALSMLVMILRKVWKEAAFL